MYTKYMGGFGLFERNACNNSNQNEVRDLKLININFSFLINKICRLVSIIFIVDTLPVLSLLIIIKILRRQYKHEFENLKIRLIKKAILKRVNWKI